MVQSIWNQSAWEVAMKIMSADDRLQPCAHARNEPMTASVYLSPVTAQPYLTGASNG
jgi:hypothetical protein